MKNKKNILLIIIGILIVVFCFVYKYDEISFDSNSVLPIFYTFKNDDVLEKKFESKYDNLQYVGISFANYQSRGTGKLNIKISNDNGKVLYENDFDISSIKDNECVYLYFKKPLTNVRGKSFTITMTVSDMNKDDLLTIWGYPSERKNLKYNEEYLETDINLAQAGSKRDYTLFIYLILYILLVNLVIICNEKGENKHEMVKKNKNKK